MAAKDHEGNPVIAIRTRVVRNSFNISFSEENLAYLMRKFANAK